MTLERYSRRSFLAAGLGVITACTSATQESTPTSSSVVSSTSTAPTTTVAETTSTAIPSPVYTGDPPFTLGIASGDPDQNSVVLWTRLLPDEATASLGDNDQQLVWEIAVSDAFDEIVATGVSTAEARYGHTVHVIADGLEPDSWYSYRFRVGEHTSTTGRTRTTPPDDSTTPLRLGFSSCQFWETGAYAAHRELAEQDLDLFVWLGDYIYEYGPNPRDVVVDGELRVHDTDEVVDLEGYRSRYALYKSDRFLQAHHAARPWLITWDDHEVDNNYNGLDAEDDQTEEEFLVRRRAAQQAWWENMPVRTDPPEGDTLRIHRTITWGKLADIHMLDGRQYRDPRPTDGEAVQLPGVGDIGSRTLGPTALDPDHSMLGDEQEAWLTSAIADSAARWTILGNQVYMHGITAFPGTPAINEDTWDGYFGNRKRLLEEIDEAISGDLVVLSGDFHASTIAALRPDPFDLNGPVVGTEFMAPAISSQFPEQLRSIAPLALLLNPQVVDFNPDNGYMTCTVTTDTWVTERFSLAAFRDQDSAVLPTGTFTITAGSPGDILVEGL